MVCPFCFSFSLTFVFLSSSCLNSLVTVNIYQISWLESEITINNNDYILVCNQKDSLDYNNYFQSSQKRYKATHCELVVGLRELFRRWECRLVGRTAASHPSGSVGCWPAPVFGPRVTRGSK